MLNLVPFPTKILQPRHYAAFQCIGADCEDTCCDGWGITVDRATYDKYQECSDPALRATLNDLVTISSKDPTDDEYASFKLTETHCPFHLEGLCSIQKKLGEDYLSNTCAIYPRMMNRVGEVLERTLDLSCPEAARIVLLDPHPMDLDEFANQGSDFRIGTPRLPGVPNSSYDGQTFTHFLSVRDLIVKILLEKSHTLGQRLIIIGHLCDKLNEIAAMKDDQDIPALLQGYSRAITNHEFDDLLSKCRTQLSLQLITVLELIVTRISSDFTGRRFLDCYQDFMNGLQWKQESNLEEIAQRYANAYGEYLVPFFQQNRRLMERYLVAYVYRNLFPLGRLEVNRKCGLHLAANSISIQCMLMMAYYAIIRTILTGMAASHRSAFGMDHVIKAIQSATKAFQHSTSFPLKAIEILSSNGMKNGAGMAMLVQDLDAGQA